MNIQINTNQPTKPFNRFYLNAIGSGHAYLTLREDWRNHVREIQRHIDFKSVRAHGIFHDLVGVYHIQEQENGEAKRFFNFQNVNKIYDFWLEQGLKPFVELSFMPGSLASGPETVFKSGHYVTPPKDYDEWNAMITAFVRHLISRYGINEVLTWNFEIWNEPDLEGGFWYGGKEAYFELYRNTAHAVKAVDERLKVGGPATSKCLWIPEMLAFCIENDVPIDFVSTHHYCADVSLEMGKASDGINYRGQKQMAKDVRRVVDAVRKSSLPNLKIHFTEWNVSPIHEDRFGKDSEFTATFVLQTLKDVGELVDSYALWCISDIFEESGPGLEPFSGKYGLININDIRKPVFHAYYFLSQLYEETFETNEHSLWVTKSAAGEFRLLAWNHCEPSKWRFSGEDWDLNENEEEETIVLEGVKGRFRIKGYLVDKYHGNSLRKWQKMDSPQYLTTSQIQELKQFAEPVLVVDEIQECKGSLSITHKLSPCAMMYYNIEKVD